MELPKFNETFLPILAVLENGEAISGRELIRRVSDTLNQGLEKLTFATLSAQ